MDKVKRLDGNFKEVKDDDWQKICYVVNYESGDVGLCTPYDTAYPIITREEILKLAEILKEEKEKRWKL